MSNFHDCGGPWPINLSSFYCAAYWASSSFPSDLTGCRVNCGQPEGNPLSLYNLFWYTKYSLIDHHTSSLTLRTDQIYAIEDSYFHNLIEFSRNVHFYVIRKISRKGGSVAIKLCVQSNHKYKELVCKLVYATPSATLVMSSFKKVQISCSNWNPAPLHTLTLLLLYNSCHSMILLGQKVDLLNEIS